MAEAQQEPDLIAPEPSVRAASLPASIDPVPVPTPSRSIHHASASNIATGSAPVPPATSQLQLRRSSTGARTVRRITTEERLGEILEVSWQGFLCSRSPGSSSSSSSSVLFLGWRSTARTVRWSLVMPTDNGAKVVLAHLLTCQPVSRHQRGEPLALFMRRSLLVWFFFFCPLLASSRPLVQHNLFIIRTTCI